MTRMTPLKFFSLGLSLLILATACTSTPRALSLQSVTVNPPSGRGNFTVSVHYAPGTKDDYIVCHFKVKDDEFARENLIGQITVRGREKPAGQSTDLEFSLSNPGNYVVDCSAISTGDQLTTDLTVTA